MALDPHASHGEVIIGAVLAQLAILGITSVVFGLMPFTFMDGYRLRTWNLASWIGVYGLAASWFALVLIRNNRDVLQNHNLPVAFTEPFILFAVFGVLSILFWLYFRLHPSPENAVEDEPVPQAMLPRRQAVTPQTSPARQGGVPKPRPRPGEARSGRFRQVRR